MYFFYRLSRLVFPPKKDLPEGYSIIKKNPGYLNIRNLIWRISNLFSNYDFTEYQIANKTGEVVSSAYVIGKIWKFPFIKTKNDIHIGPCITKPEERGKGFYPILLCYISNLYLNSNKYMIVHESNLSSIKGIEKTGFKRIAIGRCTKFKRYVVERDL